VSERANRRLHRSLLNLTQPSHHSHLRLAAVNNGTLGFVGAIRRGRGDKTY